MLKKRRGPEVQLCLRFAPSLRYRARRHFPEVKHYNKQMSIEIAACFQKKRTSNPSSRFEIALPFASRLGRRVAHAPR